MDIIKKYFPRLTEKQESQFAQLPALYTEWNSKINVISRKDIEEIMTHHILHSLAIAKFISFKAGAKVLDLGTGGGFPGIPLAIYFPETQFILMDGTGKKIQIVQEISDALGLENVNAIHGRAEESKMKVDFVVSRAVASLTHLAEWSMPLIKKESIHAVPNGLFALKGGQLKEEIKELPKHLITEKHPLNHFFKESYFEEKCLLFVQ